MYKKDPLAPMFIKANLKNHPKLTNYLNNFNSFSPESISIVMYFSFFDIQIINNYLKSVPPALLF